MTHWELKLSLAKIQPCHFFAICGINYVQINVFVFTSTILGYKGHCAGHEIRDRDTEEFVQL